MPSTSGPQILSSGTGTTTQVVQVRSWLIPLIAAAILAVVGITMNWALLRSMRENLAEELTTLLDADLAALNLWLDTQRKVAGHFASDPIVATTVAALVSRAGRLGSRPDDLRASDEASQLESILGRVVRSHGYVGYYVVDATSRPLAAQFDEGVGAPASVELQGYVQQVFAGDTVVTRPVRTPQPAVSSEQINRSRPTMFVGAPVFDPDEEVIAILAFGLPPEEDFSDILSVAQFGETGETYVFDENGVLLSQSRFEDDLREIGLLEEGEGSVLNVDIRDPGGNMLEGFRPQANRRGLPLTLMAASAVTGQSGVNVFGYRDYRGVPVIGAWAWLEQYGFGVTTEVDVAEAFRLFYTLRRGLLMLLTLLVAGSAAILISSHVIGRLREDMTEARELGPYRLEKLIGEGGMGKVYRASHALLRRPTAVKLLRPDRASPNSIARFEREVQMTAKLTHPNTVAIYDYGRTPEGHFYYAMEYLNGMTLEKLIGRFGPQAQARVVHILKQVCGSLAEAHGEGLIHRDIKPSNLMLCRRGGIWDVVKVLDFGLVREVDRSPAEPAITITTALTGTPLYISPEAIGDTTAASPKSDLYALGAVGYYLLVGDHVFSGNSVIEVCGHHLRTKPDPPSMRTDNPITPELEKLILLCLEKDPQNRPSDALTLMARLEELSNIGEWSGGDAATWWQENAERPSSDGWHVDFAAVGADMDASTGHPASMVIDVEKRGD
ncbi:MAG: serine/threonine protein kinase [Gemmatimonadetes bacterium]|nr:serine/threonine protein kinase [Gemmatimonadota bacterium]